MGEKKGKVPMLPVWLSPTQVRIAPVSEKHLKYSKTLAEKIEKENIRVDIDDRNITVPKKIRFSELEWVPYTIVVGNKEIKSKNFPIRNRKSGKVEKMKIDNFIKQIKKEISDKPFRKSSMSRFLTKRPKFVASM